MIKRICFMLIVVLCPVFCSNNGIAQSMKINSMITSGYSFNNGTGNEYGLFMNRMDHSPRISAGALVDYQLLNVVAINSGLVLDGEWISYSYSDINKIEAAIPGEPDYNKLINSRIYKKQFLKAIKLPVQLKLYVFREMFLSAGLDFKLFFNDLTLRRFETNSLLSVGHSRSRFGWFIYLEEPIKNRKLKPEENSYTLRNPEIGIEYSSRSINLAFTWKLWSKQ